MFSMARQQIQTSNSLKSNQTKRVWGKYNTPKLVVLLVLNIWLVVQNISALKGEPTQWCKLQ